MKNKKKSPKIVYTYGVYDLCHIGHIKSLKQAKKLGDFLIVGIFTDRVATLFKREPIINEDGRKATIEELDIADEVVFQDDLLPIENIVDYDVDIIAKGSGAGFENIKFEGDIKKVDLEYCDLISTSAIINKIKKL